MSKTDIEAVTALHKFEDLSGAVASTDGETRNAAIGDASTGKLGLFSSPAMKIGLLLLVAVALGGIGYLVYFLVGVPHYTCPAQGRNYVQSRTISLNADSTTGAVCVLKSTSDVIIGRSYGSGKWEESITSPSKFECTNEACKITLPADGTFFLEKFEQPSVSLTTQEDKEHSRFLIQATFGPNQEAIRELKSKSFRKWFVDQVEMSPTLHREYFRKRANPRNNGLNAAGRGRRACESYSRWHQHAFVERDIGKPIDLTFGVSTVILSVDGIQRTEVDISTWIATRAVAPFIICSVSEVLGQPVKFGDGCNGYLRNPSIILSTFPPGRSVTMTGASLVPLPSPTIGESILVVDGDKTELDGCSTLGHGPIFMRSEGVVYLHESRLVLLDNTLHAPASDYDLWRCPNVPKTILNAKSCVVGGRACAPRHYQSKAIVLNEENIKAFYDVLGAHVYRIQGLRLDNVGSPCSTPVSRWKLVDSCTPTNIPGTTRDMLAEAIEAATGNFVRDISPIPGRHCSTNAKGIFVSTSDGCFQHVHPDEYEVYDFSFWAQPSRHAHPGSSTAKANRRRDPIRAPLEATGSVFLDFPSDHTMDKWERSDRSIILSLGTFGSTIDFKDLPATLKTSFSAPHFGALVDTSQNNDLYERCGSPGEAANDPLKGDRLAFAQSALSDIIGTSYNRLDEWIFPSNGRGAVWAMIALKSKDQLRQRVAFALSGILVLSDVQVPQSQDELFLAYYDIFVRHAFGNYRDVLREVSYSVPMGIMLTFLKSKSISYTFRVTGKEVYPDENYAREIMQLFTVGLLELNIDGTFRKGPTGEQIETYTNEDIFAFARIWTGFEPPAPRANVENFEMKPVFNRIDSNILFPDGRDPFPKMNLYRGFIGDGLPLCRDLPERMFLRPGARWTYRGTSTKPLLQQDRAQGGEDGRIVLDSSSQLYAALCNTQAGKCQYKSEVDIESVLECQGIECEVQTVRMVKVGPVYYEYIQPACTRYSFFEHGRKMMNFNGAEALCAERSSLVATTGCCEANTKTADGNCNYFAERVDHSTAEARCLALGKRMCQFNSVTGNCNTNGYVWADSNCNVGMRVREDGHISLLHRFDTRSPYHADVGGNSKTFFRVDWMGGSKNTPTTANGCLGGLCTADSRGYCFCDVTVQDDLVFSSMPTKEQVATELHVGSMPPTTYGREYTLVELEGGVGVYALDPLNPYEETTIFEVDLHGSTQYFRNMRSKVSVSATVGFRNPVSIMELSELTARDAYYETDALIDHLLYHPNTAPFIAYRMIQRFVTSNPSPKYIERVAKAFKNGMYQYIGTGKHGDLAATMAAVLLDAEARDTALDNDPSFGQLREPLIKVFHLMRSLETVVPEGQLLELQALNNQIAQKPHGAPNVFSYFKPEYSPPGLVADAELVAPEAQILTAPKVISYLNGMISTVKYGAGGCWDGFIIERGFDQCLQLRDNIIPRQTSSPGQLTWQPSRGLAAPKEEVLDELDMVLTAGRLSPHTRQLILEAYDYAVNTTSDESSRYINGIIAMQQLLVGSPEYQVTNHIQTTPGDTRPPIEKRNGTHEYKTVIYIELNGGMDSFNLLVPHSNCKGDKDMYQEYVDARGDVALPKDDLLQIDVPPGEQVCDVFGLHPAVPDVQSLYLDGDALFLANVGVMVEPITKEELLNGIKQIPDHLFSHNVQGVSTQSLTPKSHARVGMLGRAHDVLWERGYSTAAYSLDGKNVALEPAGKTSPEQLLLSSDGFKDFNPSKKEDDHIDKSLLKINQSPARSIYAETWQRIFEKAYDENFQLKTVLSSTTLEREWADDSRLSKELKEVAKLIKARGELAVDRQAFYVRMFGFDTHSDNGPRLNMLLTQFNDALAGFTEEMKLQGVWDDVLIVQASEFARTLSSNGLGTDHGWGGHYMLFGGGIKGATMLGQYPEDLTARGKLNLGRGRYLPTMSWDVVWNSVASWYGVPATKLSTVIPNLNNYPVNQLMHAADVFTNSERPESPKPTPKINIAGISVLSFATALVVGMSVLIAIRIKKMRNEINSTTAKIEALREHSSPYEQS